MCDYKIRKIAICDDHADAAEELRNKVREITGLEEIDCYAEFDRLHEVIEGSYDLVFMDIDWEKSESGIDVAADFYEKLPSAKIVFVTSYTERFVQQVYFQNINVAGFLIKPVKTEELRKTYSHIIEQAQKETVKAITIKEKGKTVYIDPLNILYIESQDHYLEIVLRNGKMRTLGALASLENKLPATFVRCHRGFIVNVSEIQKRDVAELIMKNQQRIPVGRRYSEKLKECQKRYLADKI